MKIDSKTIISITLLCAVVLTFTGKSYAYIDPGTGSMIVQAVIAAVAAIGVFISVFRRRLASFLGRLIRREKGIGNDSDD